jgi:hypothetical protein
LASPQSPGDGPAARTGTAISAYFASVNPAPALMAVTPEAGIVENSLQLPPKAGLDEIAIGHGIEPVGPTDLQ